MIEIICIAIFSIEVLVAVFMQLAKKRLPKVSNQDTIKAISFIIPFHNEADRILPLIQSINASDFSGKCEFIFVDDYSTDGSIKVLNDQLKVPYSCIRNQESKGKKKAIRSGVLAAQNEFIITWDADISFKPDYIQNLFELSEADLIILPVEMTAAAVVGKLASIEFSFIETFNLGFGAYGKPIVCNGANLGFRSTTFLELCESRVDYNIPSGDDLFLMWAMQDNSKSIAIYKRKSLAISTPAPASFLSLMQQRQRWKGKVMHALNFQTFLPLFLQFSVLAASVLTIIIAIHQPLFYLLFGIKFIAELIASWGFIRQHFSHFFVLILHQIWYPIYVLVLLGIPFRKEKRWT